MRIYKELIRANSEYLSRADETALSIHEDLTIGCWVCFDAESTGVATGIISKWYETGIERSYLLYKDANDVFHFKISANGTIEFDVSDLGVNYAVDQWFYIVGRFTHNVELALFVNGTWYKHIDSVPGSIYNCAEAFEIGRYDRNNYLDGKVSHAFVCAYAVPDLFICSMFSHAKALFMRRSDAQYICTSSSTSSSSTSSSSSTTSSSSSIP